MGTSIFARLRTSCLLVLGAALVLFVVDAPPASASPQVLGDWEATYGPGTDWASTSGETARCQLCHETTGEPWNGYGWDLRDALFLAECDFNGDGVPNSNTERFDCVYPWDSDSADLAHPNDVEIPANTQPGWTDGPNNLLFFIDGSIVGNVLPPEGIGQYDPDGTGGTGGMGGMGGAGGGGEGGAGGEDTLPPGQYKRTTIVVRPGQSIQEAVDRAKEGARIYVQAGVYKEHANATNGLNITKNGIRLIGQKTNRSNGQNSNGHGNGQDKDKDKPSGVTIRNTNGQRNGIAVVPPMVTECMSCHSSMELPFPLLPGIEPGLPDPEPLVYDIEVRNIEIEGFRNGLFTERVDGFLFDNVTSTDNVGYGIFPTLSYNGVISNSVATGSHDSGIWVETSENVVVSGNFVEGNVNGFEVSNSDNILLIDNEAVRNTVGAAILLLPDIFDDRPGATHIDLVNNWFHDNNKDNTAPGGILSEIPPGIGIFILGTDDGLIEGNLIEDNHYTGIAITDYCAVTSLTSFPCGSDEDSSNPAFLLDQTADNNHVVGNVLMNNATEPPDPPFGDLSAQLILGTLPAFFLGLPGDNTPYHGNCYENNQLDELSFQFFSLYDATLWQMEQGPPPPWPLPPCL
jgi:parallel beta-helix repeat protein